MPRKTSTPPLLEKSGENQRPRRSAMPQDETARWAGGQKKLINLQGRIFGRWRVLHHFRGSFWACICECGVERNVHAGRLKNLQSQSCGCKKREETRERFRVHGMSGSKIFNIWKNMLDRCNNPNAAAYRHYGGRGITVDPRWLSFENFFADMGLKPRGMSLDRIDNNGPYGPKNCAWRSDKNQANNRRNAVRIVLDGIEDSLEGHSARTGIKYHTLYKRHLRKL